MSEKKEKKERRIQWKAVLISFGITCVLLGIVIALTIWYQNSVMTLVPWDWNMPEVFIGSGIAFLVMFFIIYHFVKKPKNKKYGSENWNP